MQGIFLYFIVLTFAFSRDKGYLDRVFPIFSYEKNFTSSRNSIFRNNYPCYDTIYGFRCRWTFWYLF